MSASGRFVAVVVALVAIVVLCLFNCYYDHKCKQLNSIWSEMAGGLKMPFATKIGLAGVAHKL